MKLLTLGLLLLIPAAAWAQSGDAYSTDNGGVFNMPATAAGDVYINNLQFTVTNAGTTTWDGNYYVALYDPNGNGISFIPAAGVAPGGTLSGTFAPFELPAGEGTYTYAIRGVDQDVTYFGLPPPVSQNFVTATVNVNRAPVTVSLSLNPASIPLGGPAATATSTAGPAGQIVYHGIQACLVGTGQWQNWGVWNDGGGVQETASPLPSSAGTYEIEAYAAESDGYSAYSAPVYLTVVAPFNNVGWILQQGQPTSAQGYYTPGQTITCTATVENTGNTTWTWNPNDATNDYFIDVRDANGNNLYESPIVNTTAPNGDTPPVTLLVPLPSNSQNQPEYGAFTYEFQMEQHNVENFGPIESQIITADVAPITTLTGAVSTDQ